MKAAEEEAIERGCSASLVQTFDFQAEGFYVHLGYKAYARVKGGFGGRADVIYLVKQLEKSNGRTLPDENISVSRSFPGLDATLVRGLDGDAQKVLPGVLYNYQPLKLGIELDGKKAPIGLMTGSTGGSFLKIDMIYITRNRDQVEKVGAFKTAIREAERIAKEERKCTGVAMYVHNFETAWLIAAEGCKYERLAKLEGDYGGDSPSLKYLYFKCLV